MISLFFNHFQRLPMNNKTGLSMVSLPVSVQAFDFLKSWHKKTGNYPWFELSYKSNKQYLNDIASIKGSVLSGHAPCPQDKYLPNLGSRYGSVIKNSLESIKASADTVLSFGGDILVLHAGYTLDEPVFTENKKRKKVLREYEKKSSYLWLKEGSICKPDYTKSDEYKIHMEVTLKNLQEAADICMDRGVKLAVENLNPRLTYLFQNPEDFVRMTEVIDNLYICVDIGHLWISSLVHKFDYFEALKTLISTGRVVTAHIHDNDSRGEYPFRFSDDHRTLGTGTVPVKKSIFILTETSSANLIIEAVSDPEKNLAALEGIVSELNWV